jgi:hypothetical protein
MNIWKNINGNYGKFFIAQLHNTKMNFSKTRFAINQVINRPFDTLKDAREFKNILTKDFKYIILKR